MKRRNERRPTLNDAERSGRSEQSKTEGAKTPQHTRWYVRMSERLRTPLCDAYL